MEIAKRRNRRRLKLESLRNLLSSQPDFELLKDNFTMLDVEKSFYLDDKVNDVLVALRKKKMLSVHDGLDIHSFRNCVTDFLNRINDSTIWLFMANWRELGAIQFTVHEIARAYKILLDIDGDTLYGCTDDMKCVFVFDYSADEGDHGYECSYVLDLDC